MLYASMFSNYFIYIYITYLCPVHLGMISTYVLEWCQTDSYLIVIGQLFCGDKVFKQRSPVNLRWLNQVGSLFNLKLSGKPRSHGAKNNDWEIYFVSNINCHCSDWKNSFSTTLASDTFCRVRRWSCKHFKISSFTFVNREWEFSGIRQKCGQS